MKFSFWTEDELKGAIVALEQGLASGVSSASYPGGGTIQHTSQANMKSTLQALYTAYELKTTGDAPKRIRRVIYTSKKGL